MLDKNPLKTADFWVTIIVFVAAMIIAVVTVRVATAKTPDATAVGLLQAITLILTVGASYAFGRTSARQSAVEIIRPHARSAFRRGFGLYQAFGRLGQSVTDRLVVLEQIAETNDGAVEILHIRAAMDLLEVQIIEQIGTANDALEDWRDIVPSEVAAVEVEIRERARNA